MNQGSCLRRLVLGTSALFNRSLHTTSACYAARKGTREKARAKKVKVEITKVGFIPHNQRGKHRLKVILQNKHLDDQHKREAVDNVWPVRYFRAPIYSAVEAIQLHKETHHPSMYNEPNADVFATVELNMEGVKKNRYIENYNRIVLLPNIFETNETRSILAFAKSVDQVEEANKAGATVAGGIEIIRKVQEGEIVLSDYDHIVAHPNIVTDLVPIRGLLKRKFPNPRAGTLDVDIGGIIKKLASGIQYRAIQDEHQKNFGLVQVVVGKLSMDNEKIAENIEALIKDIDVGRPKRDGLFVTRCFITSPPSREKLRIDPFLYIARTISQQSSPAQDDESSDDEEGRASA